MITRAKRFALRRACRLIPGRLGVRVRAARQMRFYRRQYRPAVAPRPHGLPGELILSLTSYPPRFPTLHLTLRSLLDQSVRPDRIVLWIAQADRGLLPPETLGLRERGVEIRSVPDVRSFKKLVFAVPEWPDAFIVTADDDNYYVPTWLEELVDGFDPADPAIICHRAHRVPPFEDGAAPAYCDWEWNVQDEAARRPSPDLLAVGLGGVLYPPRSLHPDLTDSEAFTRLCPNADDLWFYWCARRAGTLYKKVGEAFRPLHWEASQNETLFVSNATENDEQVRRLVAAYGDPNASPERVKA